MKLNLQYFAEGEGESQGQGQNTNSGEQNPQDSEKGTFTKDEMLSFLQSETDKRVQQALKTQQKKHEKELMKQKSLVGLDEESRQRAEDKDTIAELQEQLGKYQLASTKAEISKVLNNRGLDVNLVDFVVTSNDTDECMEKIESLDKIFKAMLKKEVDVRLKGGSVTPKASFGLDGNVTKEEFKKMSLSQQAVLAVNNRQLYDELTKR